MVIVRYVYGKIPEYVCVNYDGMYYRVSAETLIPDSTLDYGYYYIDLINLINGSTILRYDF